MIPNLSEPSGWLPLFFLVAMGIAMVAYVVLDGYDLGVGILLNQASEPEKDIMISSIGPFWDANETWLVLGVGVLLIAFPMAHGIILTELYLPVGIMLAGLILRGVSFDFRAKAHLSQKPVWNFLFFLGSFLAAASQGVMVGREVIGFDYGYLGWIFSFIVAFCLPAGYALLGASWLIMKTSGELQLKAVGWARKCLLLTALGVGIISVATPFFSSAIAAKWFNLPNIFFLLPFPVLTLACFVLIDLNLLKMQRDKPAPVWIPFALSVAIFVLAFLGIAYSMFPFIVVDKMTIWEAASATESLWVIFWGAVIVLPTIIGYTIYSYKIFWGKTEPLSYY
jgi:cytochrome d ubiquinol oxidase subunit II